MNGRSLVLPPILRALVLAAGIFVFIATAPEWTKLAADTGPAQPGPAEATNVAPAGSQSQPVVHK